MERNISASLLTIKCLLRTTSVLFTVQVYLLLATHGVEKLVCNPTVLIVLPLAQLVSLACFLRFLFFLFGVLIDGEDDDEEEEEANVPLSVADGDLPSQSARCVVLALNFLWFLATVSVIFLVKIPVAKIFGPFVSYLKLFTVCDILYAIFKVKHMTDRSTTTNELNIEMVFEGVDREVQVDEEFEEEVELYEEVEVEEEEEIYVPLSVNYGG